MSLKYTKRYHFDQSDGTDVTNSTESGNIIYTQNATYGPAAYFDGSTSLNTDTILEITGDNTRTISFWASVENFQAPILSYGNLVSPEAFVLYAGDSSGSVTFSDFSSDQVSGIITPLDTWRFYTVTYTSSVLNIFIDGEIKETLSVGNLSTGSTGPLRIGTDGAGSYLTGFLLDIRFYSTELDAEIIEYMFSVGPNYQEPAGFNFAEKMTTLGAGVHGTVLCRDMYSIKNAGKDSISSLFARDDENNIVESSRFTHTDESIKASVRTTNNSGTSYMTSVIESKPEKTSFFVTDDDDTRKSVVFSSEGIKIVSDSPYGLYFGESKDFRMVFEEGNLTSGKTDSWKIQALDDASGDYVTKLEIGS